MNLIFHISAFFVLWRCVGACLINGCSFRRGLKNYGPTVFQTSAKLCFAGRKKKTDRKGQIPHYFTHLHSKNMDTFAFFDGINHFFIFPGLVIGTIFPTAVGAILLLQLSASWKTITSSTWLQRVQKRNCFRLILLELEHFSTFSTLSQLLAHFSQLLEHFSTFCTLSSSCTY